MIQTSLSPPSQRPRKSPKNCVATRSTLSLSKYAAISALAPADPLWWEVSRVIMERGGPIAALDKDFSKRSALTKLMPANVPVRVAGAAAAMAVAPAICRRDRHRPTLNSPHQ